MLAEVVGGEVAGQQLGGDLAPQVGGPDVELAAQVVLGDELRARPLGDILAGGAGEQRERCEQELLPIARGVAVVADAVRVSW